MLLIGALLVLKPFLKIIMLKVFVYIHDDKAISNYKHMLEVYENAGNPLALSQLQFYDNNKTL